MESLLPQQDIAIRILARKYPFLGTDDVLEIARSFPYETPDRQANFLQTEIARILDSWGLQFSATMLQELAGRGSKDVAVDVFRKLTQDRYLAAKKRREQQRRTRDPVVPTGDQSIPIGNMDSVHTKLLSEVSQRNLAPSASGLHSGIGSGGALVATVTGHDGIGYLAGRVVSPAGYFSDDDSAVMGAKTAKGEMPDASGELIVPDILRDLVGELQDALRNLPLKASTAGSAGALSTDFEQRLFSALGGLDAGIRNIGGTLNWLKSTIDTERQLRRHLQEQGPLPEPGALKPGPENARQVLGGLVSDLSRNYYGREGNPARSEDVLQKKGEPGQFTE